VNAVFNREDVRVARGLARSLLIYYRPFRVRRLARFYAPFIHPGDVCFDIGSHVGNRVAAWLRLDARVVAVEPQPACVRLLRRWYGANPNVSLIPQAVGATPGSQSLLISERTPTVTTLSRDWAEAVGQAESFAGVRWDTTIPVEVTTLDELIARFGAPAFCKIDVEGYEREALMGLSQGLSCLSFELAPPALDTATACVDRLLALGAYRFNFSPGESLLWRWPQWVEADTLRSWMATLDVDDPSGDIYARRGDLEG